MSIKSKAANFIIGASLVPLGGLLAGAVANGTEDGMHGNANMSHRFECAYCFDVPESHKHYDFYIYGHHFPKDYEMRPWLTYPAMLGLGLFAVRRRWYEKAKGQSK